MAAEYMHIGIPITNRKPGMTYNEGGKFWVSNVDDYDYKLEYLKFEEGTPFPEEIHRNPHGPMESGSGAQLAFVWKDGAILELYHRPEA